MHVQHLRMSAEGAWNDFPADDTRPGSQLILVFWSEIGPPALRAGIDALHLSFPRAAIIGCSTSGIVQDRLLLDQAVCATLITFEHIRTRTAFTCLTDHADSQSLGASLAARLLAPDLAHVFVLSDGLQINGARLAQGMTSVLPPEIRISGGLAGDGERFAKTWVLAGGGLLSGGVVAVGLYGQRLRVGEGIGGGWQPFGPERLVTAADGNLLFELDGESALKLYERYLGKHARNLPASGHLFPMNLVEAGAGEGVVRSVLGVDRDRQALICAGDLPVGSTVQLMRGNPDNLLDGAAGAARQARLQEENCLAVVVSCVGRRMLLNQFADEEIEAVAAELSPGTLLTGFYSYGEIGPGSTGLCRLHNQTMSVTVLTEV